MSNMKRAASLILFLILPGLLASGVGPSQAQSFTRTFEIKGLEDGDFRIRVFVRQTGSSEGRVVPLSKKDPGGEKQVVEKKESENKEGENKQ